jgi:hypothetical protein
MAEYVADPQRHERLVREAVGRISEVLFRIANSADLTGLSLDVDLQGMQLTHEGEAREQGEKRRRVKFHQYFFNSSGSYYNHAENGLIAVDAMHTLELLREAKDILFPTMSAPVDTEMRRQLIPVAEPFLFDFETGLHCTLALASSAWFEASSIWRLLERYR